MSSMLHSVSGWREKEMKAHNSQPKNGQLDKLNDSRRLSGLRLERFIGFDWLEEAKKETAAWTRIHHVQASWR